MRRPLEFYKNDEKGKLITFCGLDGCGKSTMIKRISEYLESLGQELFITKQPTDFVRRSAIFRTYMDSPSHENYDYRSLSLLAASDRVQHTNHVIVPVLEKGKTVLSDRYFYSCLANLRARGYEGDMWIYEISKSIVKPDLAIFFDLPVDEAVKRVRMRANEKNRCIDMELQKKLHEQYKVIAEENGGLIVPSGIDEEETFRIVKTAIDKLFGHTDSNANTDKTRDTVYDILREISGRENVSDEMRLLDYIGLDSLGMVTLLVEIEERFNVEILPEDMNPYNLVTVGDVVAFAYKYSKGH